MITSFHLRNARRILGITWQDREPNKKVLDQAGISRMFPLLTRCRLRWLGHVGQMDDGRIHKDILYGELATGSRPAGRPVLCYRGVWKRDIRAGDMDPAVIANRPLQVMKLDSRGTSPTPKQDI
ncbi:uncharacterized protein LOC143281506 [Babylonia areolata]|uniref:uncharacterized protein LOC143281506 n=1 Tax=Babylonia areolata TaxID=304850 RepID=UPI003FD0A87D